MLADSLLLPECIYRPGSFSGLMLLYESNYLRLEALTGRLDGGIERWISRSKSDSNLFLERTAAARYTTTICMTYWLRAEDGGLVKDPDMTIRVYHDAGQVEAVSCRAAHRHHHLQTISRSHTGELNRRWRINMMLNKWLEYLLDNGHGFA